MGDSETYTVTVHGKTWNVRGDGKTSMDDGNVCLHGDEKTSMGDWETYTVTKKLLWTQHECANRVHMIYLPQWIINEKFFERFLKCFYFSVGTYFDCIDNHNNQFQLIWLDLYLTATTKTGITYTLSESHFDEKKTFSNYIKKYYTLYCCSLTAQLKVIHQVALYHAMIHIHQGRGPCGSG